MCLIMAMEKNMRSINLITGKPSRRSFIKMMLGSVAVLGSGIALPIFQKTASAAEAMVEGSGSESAEVGTVKSLGLDAKYIRQLMTHDSRTSRTIMWHSEKSQDGAMVVWRKFGTSALHTERASQHSFNSGDSTFFIHTATVTGLSQNTHYEYRLQYNEEATPWYPLHTPGSSSFKALIFPDSQCGGDYTVWHELAKDAFTREPDADFFINMGDLVDNGWSMWHWGMWFDALKGFLERYTFAPVMGNHETYDLNWQLKLPHFFLNFFRLPENGSLKFSRYYYSFDYGPVHFMVLNTQFEEIDQNIDGLMETQTEWLRQDAASTHKPWKIVLMHKDIINYDYPDLSDPVLGDIDIVGRRFMPLFDELGMDVVLTAHQHTYRRHDHIYDFKPSDHGPFYIDTGVAGNARYNVPINKRFDKVVLPQPEIDNYMTLEADSHQLKFRCYQPDGSIADECTLTK